MDNETQTPQTLLGNFTLEVEDNSSLTSNVSSTAPSIITESIITPAATCDRDNNEFLCDPWIEATYYFTLYGTYLAYAMGIPGSFLTLIILMRMRPLNSSSLWLLVMTFTDLFTLSMRVVMNQIITFQLLPWYEGSCKFVYIMADFCETSVYCFLIGLTMERFIAVWFPLKMSLWCTKRRAAIFIVGIQVICLSFTIHMVETQRVNDFGECALQVEYILFWREIYQHYIHNTFMLLLPVVTVIVLNILIYVRLKASRKLKKHFTDQQAKEKEKQQKQINRILTAASLWFILCVILEIVYRYTTKFYGPDFPRLPLPERVRIVIVNVAAVLRMYNHAANFVLYAIAARKFRSEVIRLVTCNLYTGFGTRTIKKSATHSTNTQATSDGESHSSSTAISTVTSSTPKSLCESS